MGWKKSFENAEKYEGDTGDVSDVQVRVKTDNQGNVTDVLVNESKKNPHRNHKHYYKQSSGTWGESKKGRG